MRITIDNLDGLGRWSTPKRLPRKGRSRCSGLNVPSRCTAEIVHGGDGYRGSGAARKCNGDIGRRDDFVHGVSGDRARRIYAGTRRGQVYRARITAVSDEWLLDNLGSGAGLRDAEALGLGGTALVAKLARGRRLVGRLG